MSRYSMNDLGFILYLGENPDEESLWDRIPEAGPAGNLAGEAIRATSKIGYRYYNDGDQIGIGYGMETCNPAARFLRRNTNQEIRDILVPVLERPYDCDYEDMLYDLNWAVRDFVMSNPDLWYEPSDDMFDYVIPDDCEWLDDEEDDYDCW